MAIEVSAAPRTPGNLVIQKSNSDLAVTDNEFFVAISHSQLEQSGIDLPLCVA
jgi:hypothetical protein